MKNTQKAVNLPKTIYGMVAALELTESCVNVRFDEFTERAVLLDPATGSREPVTDADRAEVKAEIEERFGLYSASKFDEAWRIFVSDPTRRYHPIKQRIENIQWDGRQHIAHIFERVLQVDVSPYDMEAARIFFAGGIQRLYDPGCKCDYVLVLIGTHQGEGKSTFLRWAAMEDDWYGELKTFDYQKGAEALNGKWIVEIPELAALRKSEVEEVKAFISQQRDHYRRPYDRTTSDIKRKCVMAGTTNALQFLSDPTGNRRFLPVEVHSTGAELFAREKEIRAELEQCWAEAYHKMGTPFMQPAPSSRLIKRIEEHQEAAAVDDPSLAIICSYLENREETCVLEIFYDAFGRPSFEHPTKAERNEIGMLLQRAGYRRTTTMYRYTKPTISRQAKWVKASA